MDGIRNAAESMFPEAVQTAELHISRRETSMIVWGTSDVTIILLKNDLIFLIIK